MGRILAVMAAELDVLAHGRTVRKRRMKAGHLKSKDAVENGAHERKRGAVLVVLVDERWSASQAVSDGILMGISVLLFVEYVCGMYEPIPTGDVWWKCC